MMNQLVHKIGLEMKNKEHETFELAEDVFAKWDEEDAKWYNKYFAIPFQTSIRAIKDFPSEAKWFYQRGSRGWSDRSAWSVDTWLVDNLIPMLERLKNDKHGTPASMYGKNDLFEIEHLTNEVDALAEQRWTNILNEILYGLKCAKKIQDSDFDYNDKKLTKKLNKSSKRSFELIGKHLFDLWD